MSNDNLPQSLQEYLSKHGVNKHTPLADIDTFKRQYQRLNRRRYYQEEEKGKIKRVNISLTPTEYREIERSPLRGDRKVTRFVRDVVQSFLKKEVLPLDPDVIEGVQAEMNRIGHNINQMVRQVHREKINLEKSLQRHEREGHGSAGTEEKKKRLIDGLEHGYKTILQEVKSLKMVVGGFIKNVPDLESELRTFIKAHPEKVDEVISWVKTEAEK